MASSEPEQTSHPVPAPRRRRRWPWFVMLNAAVVGLLVGAAVAVRGRSLGATTVAEPAARPTFVIAASVSPLPSGSPSPAVGAPSTVAAEYVVQAGDTLRSIAQQVYGAADQWPRIYDANRELIGSDPDALQAGMRLRLP